MYAIVQFSSFFQFFQEPLFHYISNLIIAEHSHLIEFLYVILHCVENRCINIIVELLVVVYKRTVCQKQKVRSLFPNLRRATRRTIFLYLSSNAVSHYYIICTAKIRKLSNPDKKMKINFSTHIIF